MPISNESKQILRREKEELKERKEFLNGEISKKEAELQPLKDERTSLNNKIQKINNDLGE